MAASEVTLPGIQLRFFLRLLKRRRWLILPLALLGLLVGTTTSLLIPRFYRSETQFHLKHISLQGPKLGPDEDPMQAEVEAARYTITSHSHFLNSARRLGWSEFHSNKLDDLKVRGLVETCRAKVAVYLVSSNKINGYIGISYADKDANRSAEMANTLRELWLNDRQRKVKNELQSTHDKAWALLDDARGKYEEASGVLQEFDQSHQVNPNMGKDGSEQGETSIFSRLEEKTRVIEEQEALLARLEKSRDNLSLRLAETSPVKTREAGSVLSDNPLIQELLIRRMRTTTLISTYKKQSKYQKYLKTQLAEIDSLLVQAREQLGISEVAQEENPEFLRLDSELNQVKDQIGQAGSALTVYQQQHLELTRECAKFPKLKRNRDRLLAAVEDARELVSSRRLQIAAQKEQLDFFNTRIHHEVTSEAWAPSKPNDPATWVILFIGIAIGLGVAIGFIVLIEVLRISFRSVEEVEKTLSIPVLGACTYLETDLEVKEARRRRLTITVVAGLSILSLVSIVVLYFIDPARLPLFVQNAMERIFGAG